MVFDAIGTRWVIDAEIDDRLAREILLTIEGFDRTYSRFRKDSLVVKHSKKPGLPELPDEGKKMLELYRKLYDLTNGLFTPLVGYALTQAGYDSTYSLKPSKITPAPIWSNKISEPVLLDFGALGKGRLIDIVGEILSTHGIGDYTIDAGGDILYKNSDKPIRIGLEHPDNPKKAIGYVNLMNQSICGSSGNRRKWDRFHHIINPKTLTSPSDILATWVVSDTAILADAISTCLFLVKPEKLVEEFKFEYLILYPDFSISKSKKLDGELYYNN